MNKQLFTTPLGICEGFPEYTKIVKVMSFRRFLNMSTVIYHFSYNVEVQNYKEYFTKVRNNE